MKLLFEGWRKYLNEALPPEALEKFKALKKKHDDIAKGDLPFKQVGDNIRNKTRWTGTINGATVYIPVRTAMIVKRINPEVKTDVDVSLKQQQQLEIPQTVAHLIKKDFIDVDENSIITLHGNQLFQSEPFINLSPQYLHSKGS